MSEKPRRLDAKTRAIIKDLDRCIRAYSIEGGAPRGYVADQKGWPQRTAPVDDEEMTRLLSWLGILADHDERTIFAVVLQVWLMIHGIEWPGGVFAPDIRTRGKGAPRSRSEKADDGADDVGGGLGPEAARLRAEGKSWGQIARRLLPRECATAADRQKAADKVRLAAKAYQKKGVRREHPLEGTVGELVHKILGVTPDWVLRDMMRDEVGDPELPGDEE